MPDKKIDIEAADSANYEEAKKYAEEMSREYGHDYNSAFCGYRNCWKQMNKNKTQKSWNHEKK